MSRPGRHEFLDLYRGLIVLFMLQGHVFRALVDPAAWSAEAFRLHELFHGITAPGFLFSAGFTFAIATQRRWEQFLFFPAKQQSGWSPIFLRRVWRAVLIIFVGYALHVPFLSLTKTLSDSSDAQLQEFLAFNVLQCIGLTLLFLRLLLVTLRSERSFLFTAAGTTIVIVMTTPLMWSENVQQFFSPAVAMALNGLSGSYFPLFPNAAFLLAGVLISWQFLCSAQQSNEQQFIVWLLVAGLAAIGSGFLFDALPFSLYPKLDFWTTSPNFFLMKLGGLAVLLSLLWLFENRVAHPSAHDFWIPRWLVTVGVESLFVYVAHLIVLYGWAAQPFLNMEAFWGEKLSAIESFFAFVALTCLMVAAALGWHGLKKNHPVLMQGIYWWMGVTFVVEFLTRSY